MQDLFLALQEAGSVVDNATKNEYILKDLPSFMKAWKDSYNARLPDGQNLSITLQEVKMEIRCQELAANDSDQEEAHAYYARGSR